MWIDQSKMSLISTDEETCEICPWQLRQGWTMLGQEDEQTWQASLNTWDEGNHQEWQTSVAGRRMVAYLSGWRMDWGCNVVEVLKQAQMAWRIVETVLQQTASVH